MLVQVYLHGVGAGVVVALDLLPGLGQLTPGGSAQALPGSSHRTRSTLGLADGSPWSGPGLAVALSARC